MRILAVEDGRFEKADRHGIKGKTLLLGAITSGVVLEKLVISQIEVDGTDSSERLIELVRSEKKIDLILLASIAYGGFNLMDPPRIFEQVKIPIIVVNPKKPNSLAVEVALIKHFDDWQQRLAIIKKIGQPRALKLRGGGLIYFHSVGISEIEGEKIIKKLLKRGNCPEPLRIARILAHDLSK
jgi:endonuclease V-like protein UPF0215 family